MRKNLNFKKKELVLIKKPIRLQKLLAEAGFGSRREIETLISAGQIWLNGKVAQLGARASTTDRIQLNGRTLELSQLRKISAQTLVYHKPAGEVVTRRDPEGRPTIFKRLPRPQQGRWITIGRLDITTSGLLMITTDGELAHRLMHPSQSIEREYAVRILGTIPDDFAQRLTNGIELEDGFAKLDEVNSQGGSGANQWFSVTLREGRNREVRRLWEAIGCTVSRLIRIRYGNIRLERRLFPGDWRMLTHEELIELYKSVGLKFIKSSANARSRNMTAEAWQNPSQKSAQRSSHKGKTLLTPRDSRRS